MTFDLSPEDLKVFLKEADEQLQVFEEGIMELERSGAADALLQGIFRAAHTLKGSSATLGHQRMAEFTHHAENVLDKLRKGTLDVSSTLADLLLECLDALRLFKDEIATGSPAEVDTASLIARLHGFAAGSAGAPAGGGAPPATIAAKGTAGGPFGAVDAEAKLRCREATRAGESVLAVRLRIDPHSPMPSVRAFQALHAISEQGEIVWSRPSQAEVEDEQVGEELLALCVGAAPEGLRAALGEVTEIAILALEPYRPGPEGSEDEAAQAVAEAAAVARRAHGSGGRRGAGQPDEPGRGTGHRPRPAEPDGGGAR